jgi:transcriptional regulator
MMYVPHRFRTSDLEEVRGFLKANSFGILVNLVDGRPWGSHIPLELGRDAEGREVLFGHVARANPQWRAFGSGQQVLAIFSGPHGYVSSSVYQEPDVPTWNYIAVHLYGRIEVLGAEELVVTLRAMMAKYEEGSARPVTFDGLPARVQNLVNGIVGFKIVIEEVQAALKLSQNRDATDHAAVVADLERRDEAGSPAIAAAMRERGPASQ